MNFDPNKLFYEMVKIYSENYNGEEKVVICNEGSTRSSKTWDFFHFIVMFCDHNRNKHNEIYFERETLANCKDYTLKEFKKCLLKIGIWDENCYKSPQKPEYNLFGNDIFFRGLDDSAEGYPSDIIFVNEALENQNKDKIQTLRMRCRKLFVMDWNPKFTAHWCFDLEGQPNTFFTHSTYKDNKHLEKSVIKEIESYDPSIPENIINGTADDFWWKVYGLGLRGDPKGVIFKYITWIDQFPENIHYDFGMDFGFTTDPTVIVKCAEDAANIWLECLCYEPIETPGEIDEYAKKIGINVKLPITADSADKYASEKGVVEMVHGLRLSGWNISKVSKTQSVMFWINSMKKKKIHIVKNEFYQQVKKEAENYKLREINGIAINQPIDKFNHFWDASRYRHMAFNKSDNYEYL